VPATPLTSSVLWLALFSGVFTTGVANAQPLQASGQVRLQWTEAVANTSGLVAQANSFQPALVPAPDSGATLEAELRVSGHGLTAVGTLQQHRWRDRSTDGKAWMNELYASHDAGAWQFSGGKKIVSWDVGYGFRPNDMVQQEERRTLVSTTPEGRAVLMGEHFGAESALSMVAVNPTATTSERGAGERALAARAYVRNGAADLHAFARVGERNGGSVGGAVAWVANESLELHGSLRYATRMDSKALTPGTAGLVASNPWQSASQNDVSQALVGGTWTQESQLSILLEAWWDGSAASDAQWDAWNQRNTQLNSLGMVGAPASAVAGNLAWQAEAFGVSTNLRRSNVFMRMSWQSGAWQPALDVLVNPADKGHALTASLLWQGDRVQVQGGVRTYGGPADAVLAQLPGRNTAFVAATWTF
jgi:hypothetical protein